MNWLKRLLGAVPPLIEALKTYVTSGRAAAQLEANLKRLHAMQPYIEIAARITGDMIAAFVPNPAFRGAWVAVKLKYPGFFDGKALTEDEIKLVRLAFATELAKLDFAHLSTNDIRLALEAALMDKKATKLNP